MPRVLACLRYLHDYRLVVLAISGALVRYSESRNCSRGGEPNVRRRISAPVHEVDGSVIHVPTGAEFTPASRSAESLTVWTGTLERMTSDRRIFKYADVLAAMRAYWLTSSTETFAQVA